MTANYSVCTLLKQFRQGSSMFAVDTCGRPGKNLAAWQACDRTPYGIAQIGCPLETRKAIYQLLMQLLFYFLCFWLLSSQYAPAAEVKAQSRRVIMAYTSFSPQYAPGWIAKEMNIFEKNGIRADLVYVRDGVEATQALIGGDVSFINAGVGAVVDATLGGADLIVLASPSVRSETILAAKRDITSPAKLKGKKSRSAAWPARLCLL